MNKIHTYPYRFISAKYDDGNETLFDEIIDFEIDVPCQNRDEIIVYILRFYKYKGYLCINDYFPTMWENQSDCFARKTSSEGYTVNIKTISLTCLFIFIKEILSKNQDCTMVVCGSYELGENTTRISRKLKLYKWFFYPLLENLKLKSVEVLELNAFIIASQETKISEHQIKSDYHHFKNNKTLITEIDW